MANEELDAVIAAPSQRVTKESIEARVKTTSFTVVPETTTTICCIVMDNGFTVVGTSACVDRRNFDSEIGRRLAYDNAFNKIWELEGYLLAEHRFQQSAH
jgi:hypothetical protein